MDVDQTALAVDIDHAHVGDAEVAGPGGPSGAPRYDGKAQDHRGKGQPTVAGALAALEQGKSKRAGQEPVKAKADHGNQ